MTYQNLCQNIKFYKLLIINNTNLTRRMPSIAPNKALDANFKIDLIIGYRKLCHST